MTSEIRVVAILQAKPGQAAAVENALRAIVAPSRAEAACPGPRGLRAPRLPWAAPAPPLQAEETDMKKVKTHFEVRRPRYRREPAVEVHDTTPQAQLAALQHALKGKHEEFTGEVQVVEVETHEARVVTYNEDDAVAILSGLHGGGR